MSLSDRIPLFPLDVVLLPTMTLPLHIFETRYKIMVARCLDENSEFGLVRASDQSIARIGCTAKIVRKVKDYPDGKMDILTEGHTVFRLGNVLDEKEYYEAAVEYLADEPCRVDDQQEGQLRDAFGKCHVLLFGRPWTQDESTDTATLAYWMGARLPMELEPKQELLEMRKETERRDFLFTWVGRLLSRLAARERARERAGGNGHGLN